MENNGQKKSRKTPAFLILGIIAVVAAVVLAATNMLTAGPINDHAMAALREAFGAVMPAESYVEVPLGEDSGVRSLYIAKNGDDVIGYCVTSAGKGYNGDVAVTLGVNTDGIVTGCVVGDTSFAESAGFGSRAKEPDFQNQFPGMDIINGGKFEALSGATITSTAVKNAVNASAKCVGSQMGKDIEGETVSFGKPTHTPLVSAAASAVETATVSAEGFGGGQVTVSFSYDENKQITEITSLDVSSQTEGFGQRCADEGFWSQFVGMTLPIDNFDSLSGATITSNAIVTALNSVCTADAKYTITSSAPGFGNEPVTVTVALDESGTIVGFDVDASTQTEGLGTRCGEADFTKQFIGKTLPVTGIDAVSGSTVTSDAVVEAVNSVTKLFGGTAEEEAHAVTVVPGEPVTASARGFGGDVKVTFTVDEEGKITKLSVDASTETEELGTRCEGNDFTSQFIGKTIPIAADDYDAISRSTITSDAVVAAINSVAAPAAKEEAPAVTVVPGEPVTASARGFGGDVKVTFTVDEEGKITKLSVDASTETEELGTRCEGNDFTSQFIGKTIPIAAGDYDAISRSTITSDAVVAAINSVTFEK